MYVCMYVYIYNPTDRTYNWKVLLRSLFFDEVLFIVVVLSLSHIWLFVTPWTAARQASLSLTVSWSLSKFMSIESVMPSNHLYRPLLPSSASAFNLAQHQSLFQWLSSSHQVAKVLEFQLQHQSFQWIFRMDWLDLLAVQGISRVFSNTTVQKHQFFRTQLPYSPTLTSIHDYWKNHSFDYVGLC